MNPRITIAALFLASTAGSALAANQSYSFTDCVAGCNGSVASVATLILTDITGGVQFDLTATPGVNSPTGPYIDYFKFNGPNGSFSFLSGQAVDSGTFDENKTDASLPFDWKVQFPNAANPAGNRFLNGETSTWKITGAGLDVSDFAFSSSSPMLVHVNALAGGDSIKVAPIPEPETYAMLLAGLGLLSFMARRRKIC